MQKNVRDPFFHFLITLCATQKKKQVEIDELVKSQEFSVFVIPVNAEIQ